MFAKFLCFLRLHDWLILREPVRTYTYPDGWKYHYPGVDFYGVDFYTFYYGNDRICKVCEKTYFSFDQAVEIAKAAVAWETEKFVKETARIDALKEKAKFYKELHDKAK